jgi:hypothetical protein
VPATPCSSALWQAFLESDDAVFMLEAQVRRDCVLDISGFMRSVRLILDHGDDRVCVKALPRDMKIELPALPGDGIDARDIDFGVGPDALSERNAPLPSLVVAMAAASDGGNTFIINEPGTACALRVIIAAGAAPRMHQRLSALLHQAQRAERRFDTYLRLIRSGFASTCRFAPFTPLAGQLWRALPQALRKMVCRYFVVATGSRALDAQIDFGHALDVADRQRQALLLEVLSSALEYWLERSCLDQVPVRYRDREIRHQLSSRPTSISFMDACQRALWRHRLDADGPGLKSRADQESARLAVRLSDPALSEIELAAQCEGTVFIAPQMRDVTIHLAAADSIVGFAEFGCGWVKLRSDGRARSLAVELREVGYRLPRHLVSDLHQGARSGMRASITDMRGGGGMTLHAPATVAFDAGRWYQAKTTADFRLDKSLSSLLEWSEVLARGRRLTREQDLRLVDHLQEMAPGSDHWTTGLANTLIEEMNPAGANRAADCRHTIFLLQQLQLAQLKLYLSGGLLRRLAQDQWRSRIRQHGGLASIVARITAVHVDCAWEAVNAGRHYEALHDHLCALESGERDPVRQHVLCRDRELLEMVLQVMAGEIRCRIPPHVRKLAACADDAQRKLMLKIVLIGLLGERRLHVGESWRNTLLLRLRDAGERPRQSLNMHDMALIAFLRHADTAQLEARCGY